MEQVKPGWKKSRHRGLQRSSLTKPGQVRVNVPPERLIYGLHAVTAALANPRRVIRHAYFTANAAAKLENLAASRAVAKSLVQPGDLDALLGGSAVHQGAVLYVEPLAQPTLDEFLDNLPAGCPAILVMLDQVTDPHNVGAVLRSACAFGIAAIIMQDRHSPPLSGVLAKAASGAVEHVAAITAVNLSRAIDRLKAHGFRCLGFDADAAHRFEGAAPEEKRLVFVFGAEDKGLRRLVRESCDAVYSIGTVGPIKSLNISNAAAIVFHASASSR
ncbi:MAG TPA: 23S rRNA (guanosine(2251)-2'-O)-methyltransferase RlmB [Hyphomicrobiales bacterium]|nr:23S rRNA (guanosine(2251)-2'-O)-methyltransferase RlmB [Hyphomicrobiales bacterium]